MQKKLGPEPVMDPTATVLRSTLGRYTEVGARTLLTEVEMGDYSYIVQDGEVIYSTIGKFCSIASHVRINPGNHPMELASQNHFTYRASAYFEGEADEESFFDRRRAARVTIGHDVWIGHGAIILPGRRVGDGAVVAAGAIVTKDVEPYMIVAGNPARPVRPRFPRHLAERLQALGWWHWSHEQLRAALPDFRQLSAETFVEKYEAEAVLAPERPSRS
ncbi:MAG TPA: DapH/DapD/GlmU-related protein [Mesorhizobium sp.]|jgi:hypothetical protein|nr:DapH/DapD/GlmU-related protein [Mesorhizobium sp.]